MAEESTKKAPHEEKPLDKLTVKELREIAMKIPHTVAVSDMKKEELIAFIKESKGIKEEAPAKKKKKVARLKLTKPELKTKIRELKGLREQAYEAQDKRKARDLRRLISRLKKKSRAA
jgi:hypothetical protein